MGAFFLSDFKSRRNVKNTFLLDLKSDRKNAPTWSVDFKSRRNVKNTFLLDLKSTDQVGGRFFLSVIRYKF